MTAREAVARTIVEFEGGESNHPADAGGLTRYGLTWSLYRELHPEAKQADFGALTREQVIDLCTEHFALKNGLWRIADGWVLWLVVDFAINSGAGTAIRALQRAVNVPDDGVFGPQTEYAVNHTNPERLFRQLAGERIEFLGRVITLNPSQACFAAGWMRRVSRLIKAAP